MDNVHPEPLRVHGDRLTGKRILVVGGSSGIGAAAVRRFSEEGANDVVTSRREDRLRELCEQVPTSSYVVGDIRREADVEQIVTTAARRLGGLDGAFNVAGIGGTGQIHDLAAEKFDRVVETNLRGTFLAMKHEIRAMLEDWLPTDEAKRAMAARTPLNFIALPDDIARVALFLLSDESRWITGAVLPVDGGATAA